MNEQVADCFYNIGVIYKQSGSTEKAIEHLEKSYPSVSESAELLEIWLDHQKTGNSESSKIIEN